MSVPQVAGGGDALAAAAEAKEEKEESDHLFAACRTTGCQHIPHNRQCVADDIRVPTTFYTVRPCY